MFEYEVIRLWKNLWTVKRRCGKQVWYFNVSTGGWDNTYHPSRPNCYVRTRKLADRFCELHEKIDILEVEALSRPSTINWDY